MVISVFINTSGITVMAHKPTVYYLLASVGIMVNLEPILTASGFSTDAGGNWLNFLLLFLISVDLKSNQGLKQSPLISVFTQGH